MSNIATGLFDSGLGGLSVARALLNRAPAANIIYFADTAHVPYGDRPLDEVRSFALGIVDFLVSEGAGAVLMACNMSSAIALDAARARHPEIPISGVVEAGARAAAAAGGPVGVLATAGTVASGGYLRALEQAGVSGPVIQTACPAFVPLVECGDLDTATTEDAARKYLQPGVSAGVRTFILGCTHYPFLLPVLQRCAPEGTVFVDPAEEAAREVLEATGGIAGSSSQRYILSAPSETFRPVGSRFLGRELPMLELARWEGGRLPSHGAASVAAASVAGEG